MLNEVKKYLALYQHLALPGIGNFYIEIKPAQIDFVNRSITSKKNKIVFNDDNQEPGNSFYNFISNELNTDEAAAKLAFNSFTSKLHDELNTQKIIYLEGIGTLKKENSTVVEFEPELIPAYFPELAAERIIRKNAAHTVRVGEDEKTSDEMHVALNQSKTITKERWWIAASILALIGIAAIIFYYIAYNG